MSTPKQNCGSCRYFHNESRTLCFRYPPVPQDGRHSLYPAVDWTCTCGEWQPRTHEETET